MHNKLNGSIRCVVNDVSPLGFIHSQPINFKTLSWIDEKMEGRTYGWTDWQMDKGKMVGSIGGQKGQCMEFHVND